MISAPLSPSRLVFRAVESATLDSTTATFCLQQLRACPAAARLAADQWCLHMRCLPMQPCTALPTHTCRWLPGRWCSCRCSSQARLTAHPLHAPAFCTARLSLLLLLWPTARRRTCRLPGCWLYARLKCTVRRQAPGWPTRPGGRESLGH